MIDSLSNGVRSILKAMAGLAIFGSLFVILVGIGGSSSIRTPTLIEILGYNGPIWAVLLPAVLVLIAGSKLALALRRSGDES